MNRRLLALSCLAIAVLTLDGCDMLRKIAGRPTSSDLNAMRIEIIEEDEAAAADEARQKAYEDSVSLAEQRARRSEEVLDSLRSSGSIITPSKLGVVEEKSALSANYYIIIGAFKEKSNAERLAAKVEAAGYPAKLISLKTGMNAVGICESDDAGTVNQWLNKVRNESFCPKEAWVLVRE